jgi:hypothetical protein
VRGVEQRRRMASPKGTSGIALLREVKRDLTSGFITGMNFIRSSITVKQFEQTQRIG